MNTSAAIDQLVHLLVGQRNADGFREFIHAINRIIFRKQLLILERNDSSERLISIGQNEAASCFTAFKTRSKLSRSSLVEISDSLICACAPALFIIINIMMISRPSSEVYDVEETRGVSR
jgi:hypothetical protein